MTQYLVAIHHPDDDDPSVEDEATERAIDVLNEEMVAAGVRIFVGGLLPAGSAKSLRAQPDGKVLITDGPYLETNEHIGGFWVLEAASLEDALTWGRKAVVACRAPIEVRPFGMPMTTINVNAADVEELEIVLNVSKAAAKAIVSRRSTRKFTGLADLKSLAGVDGAAVDAKARLILFE
jgi:hypothetical protein